MNSKRNKQRGFTLVEMAIVVVLGGILLAAGLVAGRGLISRSQTQDVLQIVGDLQAASNSFKQRYGYLPGDWLYAANQLPGITAAPGNGNGLIVGTVPATGLAPAGEVREVARQLYAAGLIGKMGNNVAMPLQSSFGAVQVAQNTAANTGAYFTINPGVQNVIVFFNLPCEVVIEVDKALDDANDATGKAMSFLACTAGGTAARYSVPL